MSNQPVSCRRPSLTNGDATYGEDDHEVEEELKSRDSWIVALATVDRCVASPAGHLASLLTTPQPMSGVERDPGRWDLVAPGWR